MIAYHVSFNGYFLSVIEKKNGKFDAIVSVRGIMNKCKGSYPSQNAALNRCYGMIVGECEITILKAKEEMRKLK